MYTYVREIFCEALFLSKKFMVKGENKHVKCEIITCSGISYDVL